MGSYTAAASMLVKTTEWLMSIIHVEMLVTEFGTAANDYSTENENRTAPNATLTPFKTLFSNASSNWQLLMDD